jgi:hypothetical protein
MIACGESHDPIFEIHGHETTRRSWQLMKGLDLNLP